MNNPPVRLSPSEIDQWHKDNGLRVWHIIGHIKAIEAELAAANHAAELHLKAYNKANSALQKAEQERDEAHGDAEREYGMRRLAEKERDQARAEAARLREALEGLVVLNECETEKHYTWKCGGGDDLSNKDYRCGYCKAREALKAPKP